MTVVTKKAGAAAYQLLQKQVREMPRPSAAKLSFDEFVLNMARRAGGFYDREQKQWAALLRHRKRMSIKSRTVLLAKLDRLIRETEKMIEKLQD